MKSVLFLLSCIVGVSVAQTVTIDPVGDVTAVEGSTLTITCTDGMTSGAGFGLRENDVFLTGTMTTAGVDGPPNEVNGTLHIIYLPVDRTRNGNTYTCVTILTAMESAVLTLAVTYPPQFSPDMASETPTEEDQFVLSLSIIPPNPNIFNITLTQESALVTDTRFTVNTTSLTIANVTRGDSGVYQITASNVAGSDIFTLTVDVYYPPEFAVPSQNVTRFATGNEMFIFSCTPSGGNPTMYSYTFRKGSVVTTDGVSGSVLTINPVVRSSRGVYTCEVSNTVGMATVSQNLFINVPPTMPLNPRVTDLKAFSATLQWDPPSDNGGSSLPLNYTVTFNGTSFPSNTTTSLPLPNLQHSTQYNWSVQAMNEYGTGPQAVSNFSTPDSVPIINSVSTMALNLFSFQVNITLLTDGGQNVSLYAIEIRGVNYTSDQSEVSVLVNQFNQNQVSVLVGQLDQNFTKGENYTVMVFVTNSVGTSNPQSTLLRVPLPPMPTAPPTELDPTAIPACCAGVQLNLANPDNPIDVTVLVDGTLHPANQVVRDRDFLYIMGLQAGTEYSLRIALINIFGMEWVNATVRPLLGRPSTPQVTLTPTAGTLRVQLTTMYPGTREGTLQYSISTSASPRSRRQTGQQTLTVTDLTTPVSGSEEVALGPGTYSVTVTVTNKHGDTTSVPQEVTVPATPATPVDNTALIIGVVVAAVILALLVILAVFIIVLVYMKRKDTKGEYKMKKPKKEPRNGDEDQEMMAARSEDPLAPQYEDPDTLSRKPPPAVTYKKAEEAVDAKDNPSGVVYADLDFSRQQLSKKKAEKKAEPAAEPTIYAEVRPMTPQEKQQLKEQQDAGDGEEPHSPTTIM